MVIVPAYSVHPDLLLPVAEALLYEFGHAYPEWTLAQATAELANPVGLPRSLLSIADGVAVGCASLLADDEVDGGLQLGPWLGNVWVEPTLRGRGIGQALVSAAITAAGGAGHRELYLVTERAVDWYEAQGWAADGPAIVHGQPMTLMRRSLG